MLSDTQIENLQQRVRKIAAEVLLRYFEQISHTQKADGSLLTEADTQTQQALIQCLQELFPDSQVLGEEMLPHEQQRLFESDTDTLWVIDPLDGTSNFRSHIPFFAISLALLQSRQIVFGLVYDPIRNECFTAQRGQGARLNGKQLRLSELNHPQTILIGTVDYKRLPMELTQQLIQHPPYKSQRSFGSVALDWCWLAAGRGQVYLHGRANLWDYAAGLCIFSEAGGLSCDLQGQPIFNASLQPRSAVAAVTPLLFKQWCTALNIPKNQQ